MESNDFQDAVLPPDGYASASLSSPWVMITGLLIAGLILFLGYYFGRRRTEEAMWRNREDAAHSLHKAILDRARAAAAATRPHVMAGAQALADEIQKLLGPVTTLGAFGAQSDRLRRALEGKPAEAHGHGHDDQGHDDDHGHGDHGHGDGHGKDERAKADPLAGGIHINIGDVHNAGQAAHKPDKPHDKAKGVDIEAIRKAVLDFTDYWSRPTMIAELRAAQKALVTPAPPKPRVPNLSSSS